MMNYSYLSVVGLTHKINRLLADESDEYANNEYYEMVSEYLRKSPMPVPLNLLYELYNVFAGCISCSRETHGKYCFPFGVIKLAF